MDTDELIALAQSILDTILDGCDVGWYVDLYSPDPSVRQDLWELVHSATVNPEVLNRRSNETI